MLSSLYIICTWQYLLPTHNGWNLGCRTRECVSLLNVFKLPPVIELSLEEYFGGNKYFPHPTPVLQPTPTPRMGFYDKRDSMQASGFSGGGIRLFKKISLFWVFLSHQTRETNHKRTLDSLFGDLGRETNQRRESAQIWTRC